MKTLQEIKKEIEANQEVRRANDAEREKANKVLRFISLLIIYHRQGTASQ